MTRQQILRQFDAIYFGAVGNPAIVADHISAWGLLINFRRWFDLYVNLRPVRLFEGLPCPLAGRKPGDIDYYVIRENTEGEYGNVGGRMFEGTEREVVTQQAVFSRKGVDRIMKYAFELAKTRKKHVTSCTKSNGISITMPYWDERFAAMKKQYPDIRADQYHVDGLSIQMVLNPDRFDVIVASNLFGDILSDLGPATAGTIGIAPSGNINPGAHRALDLRAGARLGARHRGQEDRQPDRPDLVRRPDARAPRASAGRRRRGARHRARDRRGPAHARHEGQGLDLGRRRGDRGSRKKRFAQSRLT